MTMRNIILAVLCFMGPELTMSLAILPQQTQPTAAATSVPVMPLAEVRTGMQGVIRTVFRGEQIEEFGFEVLGILKNLLGPKQDIILVQLKGDKPEFTGVVAGMSGSPAYIDGRQVGALSLRFGAFAKEPIAGLTPIESMLSVVKIDEQRPRRAAADSPLVPQNSLPVPSVAADVNSPPQDAGIQPPLLAPIPTPLFFTGFRQEVIDRFAPIFRRHNLVVVQGGGGGSSDVKFNPQSAGDFVPGAPVSALLVSGDLGLYATGTLSYRDGNRVLAFGHPFFQIGATDMPMARSTILKTLASTYASFKIAELKEIIGSIRQDRLTAIEGSIGVKPQMIPVRVDVESSFRGRMPYRYEVFQNPDLTPMLFDITLYESILGSLEQSDEMTIDYAGKIEVEGQPDIRMRDRLTSAEGGSFFPVPVQAAFQIGNYFSRLYNNGYESPKIKGVEISFHVVEARHLVTIEDLRSEKSEVRPGEEVPIYVYLRPYRGVPVVRPFRLKIPVQVSRGDTLTVTACDAATLRAGERTFGPSRAGSLRQLVESLNRERAGDRIYIQLSQQAPGYYVREQLLPSLPLSILSVMDAGRSSTEALRVSESPLLLQEQELDQVVRGARRLRLTVR
ncbi:MAG TPA: hypothetical protein VE398_23520 [Acidobacteriota bacterium]|nr:hypothetical protein [Acidobacteriota bacterium]